MNSNLEDLPNYHHPRVCVLAWSVYEIDARVRRYAEALAKRGSNVDVICLAPPQRSTVPNRFCLNGVNVHEIGRRIQEKSQIAYVISLIRFWIFSFIQASLLGRRERYDLVHVHSIPDFEIFAALILRLLGARIILDIHDPMPDFYATKFATGRSGLIALLIRYAERISVAFADHVITVTDYWETVIAERCNISDEKISVIMNLPDLDLFNIDRYSRKERTEEGFVLLYPGTLNKHCGLDIAIEAIRIVRGDIPNIRLEIYGKGSEIPKIRDLVRKCDLEANVILHDPVNWESVPKLMANADAGIALLRGTDRYAQNALNVKIFEFLAMGTPTIVTRTASTERYLNDKVVIYTKPNDPSDVARAIMQVYMDKGRELNRCRLEFIERFNWNTERAKYLETVNKLLTGRDNKREKRATRSAMSISYTNKIFYGVKPYIPRNVQIAVRRRLCKRKRTRYADTWPIDQSAARIPREWNGWPGGKQFAVVITHDVESERGVEGCGSLMKLDRSLGFCSSFNFVAEGYHVDESIMQLLRDNGFEIGIHGLVHNGRMYDSKKTFCSYAKGINSYCKRWNAVGFRSPSMRHNLEWMHELDIKYDSSTFDTDPFEPQPDGVGTIFPFWVQKKENGRGYVELPYTMPQDFTLFILLKEANIQVWKRKLDWIVENGGMALMLTHPDYMDWKGTKPGAESYPVGFYREILEYLKMRYEGVFWNPLPMEMAMYWSEKFGQGRCDDSENCGIGGR